MEFKCIIQYTCLLALIVQEPIGSIDNLENMSRWNLLDINLPWMIFRQFLKGLGFFLISCFCFPEFQMGNIFAFQRSLQWCRTLSYSTLAHGLSRQPRNGGDILSFDPRCSPIACRLRWEHSLLCTLLRLRFFKPFHVHAAWPTCSKFSPKLSILHTHWPQRFFLAYNMWSYFVRRYTARHFLFTHLSLNHSQCFSSTDDSDSLSDDQYIDLRKRELGTWNLGQIFEIDWMWLVNNTVNDYF